MSPGVGKYVRTEEHRRKLSVARNGTPSHFKGKKHSAKSKALISKNHADVSGARNPAFGKPGKRGASHPRWIKNPDPKTRYSLIHMRIRQKHGSAKFCQQKNCPGTSTRFEWSNKSGRYLLVKRDWWQLCKHCHEKFDHRKGAKK